MFDDRFDAALQLVPHLQQYKKNPDAVILAIPRGGLQLGSVLARELKLPLDVVLTKKIGYPGNPEYAIGAVSLTHVYVSPNFAHLPEFQEYIKHQTIKIRQLLTERCKHYRDDKPLLNVHDKIVIVVDDGVATGSTLLATLELIRQDKPKKTVVALPVAPETALAKLRLVADEVICLTIPELFLGVGQFYKNFDQVNDEQAIELLRKANR